MTWLIDDRGVPWPPNSPLADLLIDDAGEVWPARRATVARRFGGLRSPADFVVQAVTLGFIFVRFGDTGAQVALRAQFVTPIAIFRLYGLLRGRNSGRAALSHDARLSSWELLFGADRVIARIEQLVAEARNPSPRPLLIDERLPLECCQHIAGGELLPVLQAWHQLQGRWEADFYERLQEWGLLASTTITRQARGSERLLIEHWGANLRMHGKDWISVAPGRDFHDQPITELGRRQDAMRRQTIAEGVPRLEKSDHVVRRVDRALVREKFCRLGLPWRASDGAVIGMGIRIARHTIVLERSNREN